MKYLTKTEQLRRERQKNEKLTAENTKLKADIDYLAMMTNVDLDAMTEVESNEEQV